MDVHLLEGLDVEKQEEAHADWRGSWNDVTDHFKSLRDDVCSRRTLLAIVIASAVGLVLTARGTCIKGPEMNCPVMPLGMFETVTPSFATLKADAEETASWWASALRLNTLVDSSIEATLRSSALPTWRPGVAPLPSEASESRSTFWIIVLAIKLFVLVVSTTLWWVLFIKMWPLFMKMWPRTHSAEEEEDSSTEEKEEGDEDSSSEEDSSSDSEEEKKTALGKKLRQLFEKVARRLFKGQGRGLLHPLFLLYHCSHHLILFYGMNICVAHGLISTGGAGIDYEVYNCWFNGIILVFNLTAVGKYYLNRCTNLEHSIVGVFLSLVPPVGQDIMLLKEFAFAGMTFIQAQQAFRDGKYIVAFCGNSLGAATIIFSLCLFSDMLKDEFILDDFLCSHWPILRAKQSSGGSSLGDRTWRYGQYVAQTSSAKILQAEKQNVPQVLIEAVALCVVGVSGFGVMALVLSIGKITLMRVGQKTVARWIKELDSPPERSRLLLTFFKTNGLARAFPHGETVAQVATGVATGDDARNIVETFVRGVVGQDGKVKFDPELKKVEVRYSWVDKDGCRELAKLAQLQQLTIHGLRNTVDKDGCRELAKLVQLRELTIEGDSNSVDKDGCRELAKLAQLEKLRISGGANAVDKDGCRELAKLAQLQQLTIEGDDNSVDKDGCRELAKLVQLRELTIFGNCNTVDKDGCRELAKLVQLRELTIEGDRNTVDTDGCRELAKLAQLQQLTIFGNCNTVDKDGCRELAKLAQLRKLTIGGSRNTVDEDTCRELAKLAQLRELLIYGDKDKNAVDKDGCRELAKLAQLRKLTISGFRNTVDEDTCRELANKLTQLEVLRIEYEDRDLAALRRERGGR